MTTAALLAFTLSRYVFRSCFSQLMLKAYPNFKIYNHAIHKEGSTFVFFMQFSFIPYSILCYLFGLTKVTMPQFLVGALGMSIPNFFWSYVGTLLHNLTDLNKSKGLSQTGYYQKLIFMGCGFAVAMFGLYKVS